MPRLFTHLESTTGASRDGSGRDYASVQDAIRDAARAAGSVLTDDIIACRSPFTIKLMIETATGARVAMIEVSATVTSTDAQGVESGQQRLLKM